MPQHNMTHKDAQDFFASGRGVSVVTDRVTDRVKEPFQSCVMYPWSPEFPNGPYQYPETIPPGWPGLQGPLPVMPGQYTWSPNTSSTRLIFETPPSKTRFVEVHGSNMMLELTLDLPGVRASDLMVELVNGFCLRVTSIREKASPQIDEYVLPCGTTVDRLDVRFETCVLYVALTGSASTEAVPFSVK